MTKSYMSKLNFYLTGTIGHSHRFWHTLCRLIGFSMCGSRKYPYPHHRGNWKFRRGGGGGQIKAQEIPERRGLSVKLRKVCIGNHMISSAIWDKLARVNISKTNQIGQARRVSAICSLLKNLRVLIYPKLHEKNHVITC